MSRSRLRPVARVAAVAAVVSGAGAAAITHSLGTGATRPSAAPAASGRAGIDAALAFVRTQVEGIEPRKGPDALHVSRAYFLALATAAYVQSRVSPAIYAYRARHALAEPKTTAEVLASHAGVCGNQVEVFLEVARRLGLRARPIEIYYTANGLRESHIAAEVFWRGAWRFVDVTWGTVFRRPGARDDDLLSFAQVLRTPHVMRYAETNALNPWFRQYVDVGLDPFDYLGPTQHRSILTGGRGVLEPVAQPRGTTIGFSFRELPDYVGRSVGYGGVVSVTSIRLPLDGLRRELVLRPSAVACSHGALVVGGGGAARSIALAALPPEHATAVPLPRGARAATISVRGRGRTCYFTVGSIAAH